MSSIEDVVVTPTTPKRHTQGRYFFSNYKGEGRTEQYCSCETKFEYSGGQNTGRDVTGLALAKHIFEANAAINIAEENNLLWER